ncbi:MAG: dihydroorotase [Gammaproteobacteria bacterium]|nr:dihydroorotase [Gammaproteobacteria bacterium]
MLITNARIVNEGRISEADLLIADDRIAKIAASITAPAGVEVLDAGGRLLLPGMIDDQVHFREPGLMHKGDLATESAAAVAGGITSVMEMPNVDPPTTTRAALAEKYRRAAGRMRTNYAFYLGATNDNLAEIESLQSGEACALKVFMGASTGNMLVDDPSTLDGIFARAPVMVVTHCEDTPTIKRNEAVARAKYGEDVPFAEHPHIRSADACYKSTELAVGLAKKHGTRLHILHLTTARELEFFEAGPIQGKQITVEACVHHLFLDDSRYADLGSLIKCNPAVKTAADRAALVEAVREGRIDVVATDHAPHTAGEKAQSYFKAPAGLPLVQHALLILFELAARSELGVTTIAERTAHAPAQRFGVAERGFVREGCFADLTLIDPAATTEVTRESLLYKCGWSPFTGHAFPARIDATWVNGRLAYARGCVQPGVHGQCLEFV